MIRDTNNTIVVILLFLISISSVFFEPSAKERFAPPSFFNFGVDISSLEDIF
jgi:hypothetical protein